MKNAIIFHGTDSKPENFWHPSLKSYLETAGFTVELPYYPDINHQPIAEFLPKVLAAHKFDEQTVLVGHSAGSPLILSILENIEPTINRAILVAGYSGRAENEKLDPVLQASYDWPRIKTHSKDFVFINSINDPWGCDDAQGRTLFDKLDGTLIIRDDGHFGSTSYNQPYKEFTLLNKLASGEVL